MFTSILKIHSLLKRLTVPLEAVIKKKINENGKIISPPKEIQHAKLLLRHKSKHLNCPERVFCLFNSN